MWSPAPGRQPNWGPAAGRSSPFQHGCSGVIGLDSERLCSFFPLRGGLLTASHSPWSSLPGTPLLTPRLKGESRGRAVAMSQGCPVTVGRLLPRLLGAIGMFICWKISCGSQNSSFLFQNEFSPPFSS